MNTLLISLKKKAWQILEEARKQRLLSQEEAQKRWEAVGLAQTVEELETQIADVIHLPPASTASPAPQAYTATSPQGQAPVSDGTGDRPTSLLVFSEQKMEESELVPGQRLATVFASRRIRFGPGAPRRQEVHLQAYLAEVRIYVPSGTQVINDLSCILGEVHLDVRRGSPGSGPLILRLTGRVALAEVRVIFEGP